MWDIQWNEQLATKRMVGQHGDWRLLDVCKKTAADTFRFQSRLAAAQNQGHYFHRRGQKACWSASK